MKLILALIFLSSSSIARVLHLDWKGIKNIKRTLEQRPSAPGPHSFDFDWKSVENIWKSSALKSTVKSLALNVDDNIAYPNLGERIVGGNNAVPGQFPHHVLQVASNSVDSYWCGGSFVNTYWVLSAAHCTEGMTSVNVYSVVDISEGYYWTSHATSYVIPGNYNPLTNKNDITMIKIGIAMPVTAHTNVINLPRSNLENAFVGHTATVQGFGRTSDFSYDVSAYLKYVSTPVIQNSDCSQIWNISSSQVCLSGTGGKGACNGDSGGGASVDDVNGRQIIGIVSFGAAAGCQLGYPVVYTRVTSFIAWIDNAIQNYEF